MKQIKHGAKPGEIPLSEARALVPKLTNYKANKAFVYLESQGHARLGRRAEPPCGKRCYVDRNSWLDYFNITASVPDTITEPAVKKPPEPVIDQPETTANDVHSTEIREEPSQPREDQKPLLLTASIPDKKESESWEDVFNLHSEEPELEDRSQPAAPVALAQEDQYSASEIFDIVSDFESVKQKPGAAHAGSKAAVRIMKRNGISNVIVDWTILSGATCAVIFAAYMRNRRDHSTTPKRKNNADKTDNSNRAVESPGSNIRSDRDAERREVGSDIESIENVNVAHPWFDSD